MFYSFLFDKSETWQNCFVHRRQRENIIESIHSRFKLSVFTTDDWQVGSRLGKLSLPSSHLNHRMSLLSVCSLVPKPIWPVSTGFHLVNANKTGPTLCKHDSWLKKLWKLFGTSQRQENIFRKRVGGKKTKRTRIYSNSGVGLSLNQIRPNWTRSDPTKWDWTKWTESESTEPSELGQPDRDLSDFLMEMQF